MGFLEGFLTVLCLGDSHCHTGTHSASRSSSPFKCSYQFVGPVASVPQWADPAVTLQVPVSQESRAVGLPCDPGCLRGARNVVNFVCSAVFCCYDDGSDNSWVTWWLQNWKSFTYDPWGLLRGKYLPSLWWLHLKPDLCRWKEVNNF